jgi:hypothetical protein
VQRINQSNSYTEKQHLGQLRKSQPERNSGKEKFLWLATPKRELKEKTHWQIHYRERLGGGKTKYGQPAKLLKQKKRLVVLENVRIFHVSSR